MDALLRDLRFAVRSLLRTPGFTAAAVLALALGIGATTAIFSVVHAVLLKTLGWGAEDRLLAVHSDFPGHKLVDYGISPPEFLELRRSPLFEAAGAWDAGTATLRREGGAERTRAALVTSGFFETLGVQPRLGRTFTAAEEKKGNDAVAMVSWEFFRSRLAGNAATIGSTLVIDGAPRTLIGVLPEGFFFREQQDLYLTMGWPDSTLDDRRSDHGLQAVARPRPGMTLEAVRAELAGLTARIRQDHPQSYSKESAWRFSAKPLRADFVGPTREPLLLLFGAVSLVLLIACANVANLLLARSASRAREFAVRAALGAGRARLIRQLLTEGFLIAAAGAALGVVAALWAMDGLLASAPASIRALATAKLHLPLLAFAAGLSMATTLLFALAPALRSSSPDLAGAMRDAGVSGAPAAGRARAVLVAGQVALSVTLLAAAGLTLRSFAEVLSVSPGFDPDGVITARIAPAGGAFDDQRGVARAAYFSEAVRRVAALPGVEVAGAVNRLPIGQRADRSYRIEGYQPAPGEPQPLSQQRAVEPGYFAALRIPLVAGRELSIGDDARAPEVALVNEAWGRRFFPGRELLGRRIMLVAGAEVEGGWRTVVGVVKDTRELGLDKPAPPSFYVPQAQVGPQEMIVVARVKGGNATEAVRAALASVDPAQAVDEVRPLAAAIESSLSPRRFPLQLLGLFALLALSLSALGIYGVTSYAVAQRTREFGLRMAVGASASAIVRMVLLGSLRVVAAGLAVGAAGALAAGGLLSSQLYGVSPRDPVTYLCISGLLVLVALVASGVPAARAARVDPMIALRAE